MTTFKPGDLVYNTRTLYGAVFVPDRSWCLVTEINEPIGGENIISLLYDGKIFKAHEMNFERASDNE